MLHTDIFDRVFNHSIRLINFIAGVKKELRDVSREVRIEAVRAVALGSSACVDDLLDVLSSEAAADVRRLIFARITRSIDVTDLSLTQRMCILRIGLNDEDGP